MLLIKIIEVAQQKELRHQWVNWNSFSFRDEIMENGTEELSCSDIPVQPYFTLEMQPYRGVKQKEIHIL